MNNSIILPGINTPITPESEKFRRAIVVRDFCGQVGTNEIEQVNQLAREKFGACGLEYLLAELVSSEKRLAHVQDLHLTAVGERNSARFQLESLRDAVQDSMFWDAPTIADRPEDFEENQAALRKAHLETKP